MRAYQETDACCICSSSRERSRVKARDFRISSAPTYSGRWAVPTRWNSTEAVPPTSASTGRASSPTPAAQYRQPVSGSGYRINILLFIISASFINAVLEDAGTEPVEPVKITSPFNLRQSVRDKETIMDVKVPDSAGRSYDIEIQNVTSAELMERLNYYG
ncbi:MAG TPA: hypothetical protein DCL73_17160, partial [Treponema sp.]|nr:hypothetical protein [Treponema sp.]